MWAYIDVMPKEKSKHALLPQYTIIIAGNFRVMEMLVLRTVARSSAQCVTILHHFELYVVHTKS